MRASPKTRLCERRWFHVVKVTGGPRVLVFTSQVMCLAIQLLFATYFFFVLSSSFRDRKIPRVLGGLVFDAQWPPLQALPNHCTQGR